uniref:Uncharacterized protein n=1 Tax=Moniliophthora roreri TaxID=221103 RepID=A0A0W0FKA4_MONRR
MPFTTHTISPLALGLPPSPENAPPVINIDRTVAMFSLHGAHLHKVDDMKDVAVQRPKIEDEFSEGPRLFRILNRGSNTSSASNRPFAAEKKNQTPAAPICPPPPQEHTRQRDISYAPFQHPSQLQSSFVGYTSFKPWGPDSGDEVYLSNKRGPAASLPLNSSLPVTFPQFSESSTLSPEEKIIRRPLPRAVPLPSDAENDVPHFTNPFDNVKPKPNPEPLPGIPKDGVINLDDYDLTEERSWPFLSGYDSSSSEEESENSTPYSSPSVLPRSGPQQDLFANAFKSDLTSIIQCSRVYPSSTEPDWRVGEYWYCNAVIPSSPVFRMADVEIESPKPYSLTQGLALERMLTEMGCRRD